MYLLRIFISFPFSVLPKNIVSLGMKNADLYPTAITNEKDFLIMENALSHFFLSFFFSFPFLALSVSLVGAFNVDMMT